jgi:hypothetical protein
MCVLAFTSISNFLCQHYKRVCRHFHLHPIASASIENPSVCTSICIHFALPALQIWVPEFSSASISIRSACIVNLGACVFICIHFARSALQMCPCIFIGIQLTLPELQICVLAFSSASIFLCLYDIPSLYLYRRLSACQSELPANGGSALYIFTPFSLGNLTPHNVNTAANFGTNYG